jgi:hypothetical protein
VALALANPVCAQQTPEILATGAANVGVFPDQLIVDNGTIFWSDLVGRIRSVAKPSAAATVSGGSVTRYTPTMIGGGSLLQDTDSLYFIGPNVALVGGGLLFPITKMSKAGGFVTPLDFASAPGGAMAIGIGRLYYRGAARNIPASPLQTNVIESRFTNGGTVAALLWDSSGGPQVANALSAARLPYAEWATFASPAADLQDLYWAGGPGSTVIWRMSLLSNNAESLVVRPTAPVYLVKPTQEASLYWTEPTAADPNVFRLMRMAGGGGQLTTLAQPVNPYFAVDGDKVFYSQGGALKQISINGGTPVVLADGAQAHTPWGIAVDSQYVYWNTSNSEVMRLLRTDGPSTGGGEAPVIATHPASQTVTAGQNATFTVVATGTPALTYQWQMASGGGAFTNLADAPPYSGTRTATLVVSGVPTTLTGSQFRAVATNSFGSATSNAATLTVTAVPTCSYTIGATAAFFGREGGSGSVTVTPSAASCAWTASSNAQFLTITSGASGTGTGSVGYSVGTLGTTTTGTRMAMLTIGGQTLTMTQSAADLSGCSFSLSSTSATFPLLGGTGTVTATPSPATCAWTAVSGAPFIAVTAGAAGTGARAVTYTVSSASAARAGTMTIAGRTFTVTQTAATCTYSVSPINASFDVFAGSGSVAVTVNAGAECPWTAMSNDPFIVITSGASGSGNGSVQYSVADNKSTVGEPARDARLGTLTIAGRTVTVAQEASLLCDFAITPQAVQAPNDGGTYGVTVSPRAINPDPSCSWTAVSHDSWLTMLSGSTASLQQSVGTLFYVAPNSTNTSRTGTLNIAGQTLTVTQGLTPVMTLSRASLAFAATSSGTSFTTRTPPQSVRLSQNGTGTVTWTAASNKPWLAVSPSSGTGAATLTIGVAFDASVAAPGNATGGITITFTGAGVTAAPRGDSVTAAAITVSLSVVSSSAPASPPVGVVDTPAGDSTRLSGSIAVTGWTVDNIGVKRVELWRAVQPGETTPPFSSTPDDPRHGMIFIDNAIFTEGARPDIETLHPSLPMSTRAGWGYLLLTSGLWNQGNGTYTLRAFAFDEEDNVSTIGSKTIVVDNNSAAKPFGSIDTPGIGGDAGTSPNFGWALTPKVNGAPTCRIPSTGVQVSIDSGPLQPVVYGDARTDIAGAFPGYSNSTAAGGHFIFDWSTLSNGPHTIGWLVTDDCNRADGVGSRFFTVTTGVNALTEAPAAFRLKAEATQFGSVASAFRRNRAAEEASAFRRKETPLLLARGYGELPEIVDPGPDGTHTIEVRQGERIEIRLPHGFASAHQLGPMDQRRALPIGAT